MPKMLNPITLVLLLFSMLLVACQKEISTTPDDPVDPIKDPVCDFTVGAYDFGVEHLDVPTQVKILDSLGMDGIMVYVQNGDAAHLKDFYQTTLVQQDSFEVYDAFAYLSLTDSNLYQSQLATIEAIYQETQHHNTRLQVIFLGQNESPVAAIKEVADLAAQYGQDLILYPHYNTSIESAEEAVAFADSSQKNNVFISLHLCHELAYGNANRIGDVVQNVIAHTRVVSISGASLDERQDTSLPNWYWGIKPLYMGSYELSDFVQALHDQDYKGPYIIHTYAIKSNFGLDPETHLPLSKSRLTQLVEEACK